MRLSDRSHVPDACSPEHARLAEACATAIDLVDLTVSNPTAVGLVHPPEVYRALGDPAAAVYTPAPFGLASARAAVVDRHARDGIETAIDRVWLTASTSEAYAQLMLLTADPGDVWWVPQPGYPLLEALARPLGVQLRGYPLAVDGRWSIDTAALADGVAAQPRSRAIVAVAPGNPTGAYLARSELGALAQLCCAHGRALVVDEVFAEYPLSVPDDRVRRVGADPLPCATFVLSGLSKLAALPQVKLGWVVVHGPAPLVTAALARAEHLCDAWLSVATPVQLALPQLLAAGDELRPRILARLRTNLALLQRSCADGPADVLAVEGGWIALVRLPALLDDLGWAIELCTHAGVLVQPGYLYDLPAPPRIAISLLVAEDRFAAGVGAAMARVRSLAGS